MFSFWLLPVGFSFIIAAAGVSFSRSSLCPCAAAKLKQEPSILTYTQAELPRFAVGQSGGSIPSELWSMRSDMLGNFGIEAVRQCCLQPHSYWSWCLSVGMWSPHVLQEKRCFFLEQRRNVSPLPACWAVTWPCTYWISTAWMGSSPTRGPLGHGRVHNGSVAKSCPWLVCQLLN